MGDLSAEVALLQPDDELLVPRNFFPRPLANGNLLLMRSNRKLMRAFERTDAWRRMLKTPATVRFDEWSPSAAMQQRFPTMLNVYEDMRAASQLNVRPTQRMMQLDSVVMLGKPFVPVEARASTLTVSWRVGVPRLVVERAGACICPQDVVPQLSMTMCSRCSGNPGRIFSHVQLLNRTEMVAFHFMGWKRRWKMQEYNLLAQCNGSRPNGAFADPMPACDARGLRTSFDLTPNGFKCER